MSNSNQPDKKFTNKEKAFVFAYLGNAGFCAARAARMAGYKAKSSSVFASIGAENLRKPHIQALIEEKMTELAMPAAEVLARLTAMGRASIDDVTTDDGTWFDLQKARENGAIHMIKSFTVERGRKETTSEIIDHPSEDESDDSVKEELETSIVYEKVKFEMYDAKDALKELGKHHKLFTDKIDVSAGLNHTAISIYIPDNGRDTPAENENERD